MSSTNFRLGGAGGYSVRTVGHAPTRQGSKPVYERVQLWHDEQTQTSDIERSTGGSEGAADEHSPAIMLGDWALNPPSEAVCIHDKIRSLSDLDGRDANHLHDLANQAWKLRAL